MKRNRIVPILIALMIAALLCGCGAKQAANDAGMMAPEMDGLKDIYVEESAGGMPSTETATGNSTTGSIPQNQKLIRTLELNAETEDLDALLANVEARVRELGGYVEQKDIYRGSAYSQKVYRNGNMTIRIPAEVADQFVSLVGEVSNITSSREDIDDVSLQYVATESRILALETEQTRLLELLEKAENMEDLLMIESRLTEVRYELEQVTSQLRLYDNLVNYATIHLSLQEVRQYTPVEEETFWQRIVGGLSQNLKNLGTGVKEFLIIFITGLPYLIPIGLVVMVAVLMIRKRHRRKKRDAQQTP